MRWPWQKPVDQAAQQFALSADDPKPSMAVLFRPEAQFQLADALGQLGELDAVLRKAGKSRTELRALEGDDEIAAALETRESALLSIPWRLEPWTDNPVAETVWEIIEPHMESIIRSVWSAVPYGYSVLEAVWTRRDGRVAIEEIQEKPFEWFEPTRDNRLLYYPDGLRFRSAAKEVDTSWKFFLTRRRPTYRNPRGEPLLSRLFWPWFFRSKGWSFWARFLERHGAPLVIGKTKGDVEAMADALAKLVNAGVAAFGEEDQVDSMTPGNAGLAFEHFSRAVDKRIQKVILGQTLTTDVSGGGSYAAARVQDLVREDRLLADVRLVRPTLQRIVNAITWLNFPDAEPPTFAMEAGEGLALERAERDSKLVSAGVLRLTPQYLLNRYDFEEGDFELAPQNSGGGLTSQFGRHGMNRLFAARKGQRRFTPDQQALEDLIDQVSGDAPDPIPAKALRDAITASTGPDDLVRRLGELYHSTDAHEFQELIERALFAADIMGYAAAEDASGASGQA